MCGPSGTGKTHFLEALGHSRRRCRPQGVLVQSRAPRRARAPPQRRRHRRQGDPADHARRRHRDRRHRPAPGHQPRPPRRSTCVVDAAYEKRSIALSSNLHPAGFDELMPKTIANATVDRLLHHAHVVHDRRRQHPPHPSHRRQGGDATDQLTHGQNTWPPPGSSVGCTNWAVLLSATGQIPLAVDTASAALSWASAVPVPAPANGESLPPRTGNLKNGRQSALLFQRILRYGSARPRPNYGHPQERENPWSAPTTELWAPTRSLRPFPEGDPDFKLFGLREDIESLFSDLKYRTRGKLPSIYQNRNDFNIVSYMVLRLSRSRAAHRKRSTAPDAVPIAA